MQKRNRQNALLSIIDTKSVSNQADLAALLVKKGFNVTQASVSRDLVEMGVVKVNGRYSMVAESSPPIVEFGKVTWYRAGPNLIVGKCLSGLASAVTVRIDAAKIPELVGTIAGDDTIFIAVDNTSDQKKAFERLEGMFPGGESDEIS